MSKYKKLLFVKLLLVKFFILCLVLKSLLSRVNQHSSQVIRNFFILCLISSDPGVSEKVLYFYVWSVFVPKYKKKVLLEKYKNLSSGGIFFVFPVWDWKVHQVAPVFNTNFLQYDFLKIIQNCLQSTSM